ncbi:MAG: zinc-binding dehydrogenase [Chloroflexi bacterium]|nr:zinc-binding dehydrogenase [Chloroflexota bacterium]
MRAVQCVAPGEVRFVEAPKPQLKPGHALIRTMLLALCGSDVHMVYYAPPDEYPFPVGTAGHEMIGLVEAVDAPGFDLKPGDVALTLAAPQTAMAEYYLASAEDVLVLPAGKPLEQLLMSQQLGTVIYALKRLPSLLGKDVVIIGQGSAGLFFDAMCRRMGAEKVIGLDIIGARVAAGLKFGATHAVNNAQEDALEVVTRITGGRLADVVIEAAGEVETINLTAHLVKTGGHLMYFGIPRAHNLTFDFWTLFRKYCYTTSSGGSVFEPGRRSFHAALDLVARGVIDVTPMPTHRLTFEQVIQGYELARTREDGAIKVVIEMPGYRAVGGNWLGRKPA